MANRKWRELSTVERAAVIVLGSVEFVLTTAAVGDLRRRSQSEIRGPKALWWAAVFVQPFGAPAYLAWGRRAGRAAANPTKLQRAV